MIVKARTATIFGSLVLHALVALAALYYVSGPHKQKHQSIAVMADKKKEAPKPPPPAPLRPRPKLAMATPVAPAPVPQAEPPRAHSPQVAAPMSNDGGGGGRVGSGTSGLGSGSGSGSDQAPPKKAVAAKVGEDAPCTEQPTKAAPVSRPTEIEYTQAARADGIEGRLVLKIVIGADGAVQDVIVVSSVDPALDAAAIAAVKTWVFRPSMRCGKPMAGGTYTLAQRFELGD